MGFSSPLSILQPQRAVLRRKVLISSCVIIWGKSNRTKSLQIHEEPLSSLGASLRLSNPLFLLLGAQSAQKFSPSHNIPPYHQPLQVASGDRGPGLNLQASHLEASRSLLESELLSQLRFLSQPSVGSRGWTQHWVPPPAELGDLG